MTSVPKSQQQVAQYARKIFPEGQRKEDPTIGSGEDTTGVFVDIHSHGGFVCESFCFVLFIISIVILMLRLLIWRILVFIWIQKRCRSVEYISIDFPWGYANERSPDDDVSLLRPSVLFFSFFPFLSASFCPDTRLLYHLIRFLGGFMYPPLAYSGLFRIRLLQSPGIAGVGTKDRLLPGLQTMGEILRIHYYDMSSSTNYYSRARIHQIITQFLSSEQPR